MLKLLCLTLSLSLAIPLAHAERVDECTQPGTKLSSNFLKLEGELTQQNFNRTGSFEVSKEATFTADLTAVVSKVLLNKYCVTESYQKQETKCAPLEIEVALGRGNANFKGFYDLSKSLLTRAQTFSKLLSYDAAAEPTLRLETAKAIISALVLKASSESIPTRWSEFVTAVSDIATVDRVIIEDLTVNFETANKNVLGFAPVKEATIKEEEGNAKMRSLFDLGLSENNRSQLIKTLLEGLSTSSTTVLAKNFIEFASINGIPASWDQFSLMLKGAFEKNLLTVTEYKDIVTSLEFSNRKNLGFNIQATLCKTSSIEAFVNVIREKQEKEFHNRETRKVTVNVSAAPLLSNESELISAYYDGVSAPNISVRSGYNNYTVATVAASDTTTFNLTGSRIKVALANSSFATIVRTGDVLDVNYQNKAFNPNIDGKVVVIVDFYERRFFGDKLIGSRTITPVDGTLKKYLAQVKMMDPKKKPYIVVKMKYENSSYYNSDFTQSLSFE